jgi:hypothetical protein
MDRESTTRMSTPSTARAAFSADCIVAERALDRSMHTMPDVSGSAARDRKAASNAPGGGAAVWGSTSEVAIRR